MTTIKELKQWLNNFPEDTIVEFAVQQPASMYQSYGDVKFLQPNLQRSDADEGWEFLDFIDNQYVKKDAPHFGKCFLRFGESFAHRTVSGLAKAGNLTTKV